MKGLNVIIEGGVWNIIIGTANKKLEIDKKEDYQFFKIKFHCSSAVRS